MRETGHPALPAADEAGQQVAGPLYPDDEGGAVAPSPAFDISSRDPAAPEGIELPGTREDAASPRIALSSMATSAASASGYSIEDLALFRMLTGYRLDTRTPIWRAVDSEGNRVSAADRLFTTLAEEAFRFADRQRRLGGQEQRDLTIDDLVLTLSSIRRAANSIGSRGQIAFERLETAIVGFRDGIRAETLSGMTGMAAVSDDASV